VERERSFDSEGKWFFGIVLLFCLVWPFPDLRKTACFFCRSGPRVAFSLLFHRGALRFLSRTTRLFPQIFLSAISIVSFLFAAWITVSVFQNVEFLTSQNVLELGFSGRLWPIQWLSHPFFSQWASSYFYVNTLSYFFELTAFLPLGLLLYRIERLRESGKKWSIGYEPGVLFWGIVFLAISGTVCVLLSRGALVAFFLGLLLFFLFLASKRGRWILPALLPLLFLAGFFYWSGMQRQVAGELGTLQEDIAAGGGSFNARFEAWQTLIHIFRSHPWVGSGPGTYPIYYYFYKLYSASSKFSLLGFNDPLQLLAELGITGGILFVSVCAAYLFYFFKLLFSPERSLRFFSSLALTCGIMTVFLHSLVESGLQSFSISCLVALYAGANMGACHPPNQNQEEKNTARAASLLSNTLRLFSVVCVLLLGSAIYRWWVLPWSTTSRDALENALTKVKIDPGHPYHHARLGDLYLSQATGSGISTPEQDRFASIVLVRAVPSKAPLAKTALTPEQMGYLEMARHEYETIKKLDPYSFDYYGKMAQLYIEESQLDKAAQVLKEWEETFPNAIDAKIENTLYYLEMSARDKPENPAESTYFGEAKAAVGRARTHQLTFNELSWRYWKEIYERFKIRYPELLKAVAKSDLLKDRP